ncbi:MTH1187 family thiamine-binding protein [uncultured Paludibaculum sp.]|uniref:MTH1187 family thiamine-binding protein n=1 Tax=uncultured Paludibaculum sp. TaxID=1765020 RepID=UPI002AAA887C|nr:MTH1187 family thiamine-binding protein [uncultured Paludibaculum sp.]
MHTIADICVIPLGVGTSVSREVTVCERILRESGLKTMLHAYGTNVEGEWDDVMAAIKRCHEALHAMGVPRISTNIRIGTRTDKAQTMQDKVERVERRLVEDTL